MKKELLFVLLVAACTRRETPQPAVDSVPAQVPADTTTAPTNTADLIRVTAPLPDDVIRSPVTVAGEARGNWYFEASFPVILLDANGDTLAVKPAQAQGEWMTENLVPFSIALDFTAPATPTGTVVLKKDNASGLPEHDAELRIPVRFKP